MDLRTISNSESFSPSSISFNQVEQYPDDQFLLLRTREFLELLRFHHETTQDWGDVLLRETVVDVFGLEFFDRLYETVGINLTGKFCKSTSIYILYIL